MRISNFFVLICIAFGGIGCSLDGLFAPNDSGQSDRKPRDRREQPETNTETELYIPLKEGAEWSYNVKYAQHSLQGNNATEYNGVETWRCTSARLSDSTFVFSTFFGGEIKVKTAHSSQVFPESSTASVATRIENGALIIVQENGGSMSPFLGDWLYLHDNQFYICFDKNANSMKKKVSTTELTSNYELEKSKGLISGELFKKSVYDQITISYTLKN